MESNRLWTVLGDWSRHPRRYFSICKSEAYQRAAEFARPRGLRKNALPHGMRMYY